MGRLLIHILVICLPLTSAQLGSNGRYTQDQIRAIRNYFKVETRDGRQVIVDQDGDEVDDNQTYRFATTRERFEHRVSEEYFENIIQDFWLQFPFCINGLTKIAESVGVTTNIYINFLLGEICEELLYAFFDPMIDPLKQAVLGRGPDYQDPVYVERRLAPIPTIVGVWNFFKRHTG